MRCRHAISAFLALLFCTWTQTAFAEKRIGIFIGTNEGYRTEEPLKYAVADAYKMKNTFLSYGNVKKENAFFLKHPNRHEMANALQMVKNKVAALEKTKQRVVLVFYFTGHGDRQYLHLGTENFSRKELMTKLKTVGADLVVCIIDACQTDRRSRQKGVRVQPRFDVSAARLETHEGVVTIQSTMEGSPAYESDELQSALFTHHFVSALRGAADQNHDKRITLLEAYSYSYRETVQTSAEDSQVIQQPHFDMTFRGAGDLVLTDLQRAKSTVIIKSNTDARYVLFSKPLGQPIAEIYIEKKNRRSLAMAHGNILIHKRTAHGAYAAEVYVPRNSAITVTPEQFKRIHVEQHTMKGSANLHPHQLATGVLFSTEHFIDDWRLVRGLSLDYQYHFRRLAISIATDAQFSSFKNDYRASDEVTIGLLSMVGWHVPLRRSLLLLSAGPGLQMFSQKITLRNFDRIQNSGLNNEEFKTSRQVAPGGRIAGEWQVLFSQHLGAFARGWINGFYYRDVELSRSDAMMRWQFGLGCGVYVRF